MWPVLGVGETAPGRKGAGISESMLSISSSPKVLEASEASCSHDKIEPRACLAPCSCGGRRDVDDESLSGGRGDRYDIFARVGRRLARVGVWGTRRFRVRDACIRGIAGVGAPSAVTGAKRSSTSSISLSLSSLLPSDICDILPTALGVGLGLASSLGFLEWPERGEGLRREDFSCAARRKAVWFFALGVLGV
jgi:hypothetical protein